VTMNNTHKIIDVCDVDDAAVDDLGVTHGVTPFGMLYQGCGWDSRFPLLSKSREPIPPWVVNEEPNTFECPNCERTMCYCAGHDACDLCDECCMSDHF
jgi:hypothetical protein